LRPWRRDSALASDLSGLAQASRVLRPVRSLTRPEGGPLSPGLRWFGHPSISRVAIKAYRHLLELDFHRLRGLTFARHTLHEHSALFARVVVLAYPDRLTAEDPPGGVERR